MQSNRDHGAGARSHKKKDGEGLLRPSRQRDLSTVLTHPVLIALVRLLAREAAAKFLAAPDVSSPPAGEGR